MFTSDSSRLIAEVRLAKLQKGQNPVIITQYRDVWSDSRTEAWHPPIGSDSNCAIQKIPLVHSQALMASPYNLAEKATNCPRRRQSPTREADRLAIMICRLHSIHLANDASAQLSVEESHPTFDGLTMSVRFSIVPMPHLPGHMREGRPLVLANHGIEFAVLVVRGRPKVAKARSSILDAGNPIVRVKG